MKVLTRFFSSGFVALFALTLCSFTVVMVGGFLYDLSEVLFSGRANAREVALLLAYKLPALVMEALPLAVLLAMWLLLERLRRDGGLVALKAAGLSFRRAVLPLVGCAVAVALLALGLQEHLVPTANHKAEGMVRRLIWREASPLVRERVFFKDGRGRFFYIRQVEESGPVLRGLTVYDASDASAPVLLVARSGRVARGGGWSLEDGILYRMDAEGFVAQEVRFATFRLEVDERLDVFLGEQKTTLEMTRRELAETIALFRRGGVDVTPLVVDYHLKLALPWTNLVFALLVLGQAAYLPTPRQEKRLWGLGVVTALAFLYYLAAAVARSLGVHGRLAPATAAWLAPVGFSLLGLAGLGHEPPGGGGRRRKGVLLAALFLLALALLAAGRCGLERARAAELPEERAPAAEVAPEDWAEPSGIDQGPDSEAAATRSWEVESEQKEPLRLTAERVFYRSDKVLEARGRVRIAYGEVELEAEEVQVDTEQEILYAAGAVKVTRGEDALGGEDFVYRLREKSWALRLPSGRVRSRRIVGEAFLRAEEVEQPAGTDDFLFRRGSATTCDQPEPHYHIEGERIEYYPGDKVVIRPATYYEGRVALFTLPVLVIYLGEEDRRFYPTVGYNERDGFFILTAYHFLVEPKVTGILLADWFQKRGMAGGVEWRLRPGPEQQGKFLVYQKEGQGGQKDLRLQGSWEAGPPQDRLTAEGYLLTQNQWGQGEERLVLRHHSLRQDVMVGWRSVGGASGGEDLLYEGSYRRSLAPGWQLSASGSYFRPSSAEEGKINGSGELSYEGTSLRASAGLLRDAWLRKSVARGRVGTKTLPYVNFELSGEETYWDDYDLVSYRTQLTARTYEYAVPLHPAVQGFHRYAFTVTDYDGTSWQETLTGTLGVRVGKPSSQLVLSYSPMRIWGQTPVLYRETVGDRLDAHLYLSGPMGVLTARTGYNVPLARYDDLVLRASSGPSSQAELAYDLNAGQLKTFGGGVRIRVTEAVTVGVAGRYDARQMSLEELRTSAEVVVAPGVTLEYEQTTWSWYRRTTSTWRVKGDLHCRTVHLVWKPQEGTFFVELLFKAFPQDLLRLGNDVRINL